MGSWATGMMLPDIPRAYTAAAEWLACMICILQVHQRRSGWSLGVIAGLFLAWQTVFLVKTDGLNGGWWVICMLAAIFFMFLFIYICCRGRALDSGYRCVEAFVLAELAASLGWQMYCYTYYELGITSPVVGGVVLAAVYVLLYGGMYLWTRHFFRREESLDVSGKELILAAIIGATLFAVSNLSFTFTNTPFSANYSSTIFNIRTLIDAGGMAILYAYHVQRQNLRFHQDLEMMESMLERQYIQYQQSRETLDMINYKYHDLKNHIIALRAESDSEKYRDYLDKMEASINSYETQNKTGNKVLDIILTSKGINCMNNHISLTSVVDGALLDFMDATDVCSIFGNALDNAIECEKKIPETEKRMIHLSVFSQRSFLIIRCENYCEEDISLEKGLPRTTKEGKCLHGYGIKSIRSSAQKYGGEMDVSVKDNCFSLKVLIPMNQMSE